MAVSKERRRKVESMRNRIEQSDREQLLDLLGLLNTCQTEFEQQWSGTFERNGVGFSGFDAPILTSIYENARGYGSLTPKQAELVQRKLKKYAGQLVALVEHPVDVE